MPDTDVEKLCMNLEECKFCLKHITAKIHVCTTKLMHKKNQSKYKTCVKIAVKRNRHMIKVHINTKYINNVTTKI